MRMNLQIKVFGDLQSIECTSDIDRDKINDACVQLEALSRQMYEMKGFTVIPLKEVYEQAA